MQFDATDSNGFRTGKLQGDDGISIYRTRVRNERKEGLDRKARKENRVAGFVEDIGAQFYFDEKNRG